MSELPKTVTLPSGASIELRIAPFADSMRLLRVIANEAKGVALGYNLDLNISDPRAMLAKLAAQDLKLDLIKDALCQIAASEAVAAALDVCMGRCVYNGEAIRKDSFEAESARADYFPAAWEVMKLNLSPFFAGLVSKSSASNGRG